MAVLTIAREHGAIVPGEELTLCNSLNLRCISKSTLERKFAELGIEKDFLTRFDECKPGIIGSITNSAGYYWETLKTVVMQELLQDDIAIFGRGGNFLLDGVIKCFRIRLIAPEEFRIQQVAAASSISTDEAKKAVRQSDSERKKFCDYYYGKNWADPHNYDLVVNTAEISLETLAKILPSMLVDPVCGNDKDKLRRIVQAQLIKHTLYSFAELQMRFSEIEYTEDNIVIIRGNVPSAAAAGRVEEIVRDIPGVKDVQNELVVVLNDIPNRLPPFA